MNRAVNRFGVDGAACTVDKIKMRRFQVSKSAGNPHSHCMRNDVWPTLRGAREQCDYSSL